MCIFRLPATWGTRSPAPLPPHLWSAGASGLQLGWAAPGPGWQGRSQSLEPRSPGAGAAWNLGGGLGPRLVFDRWGKLEGAGEERARGLGAPHLRTPLAGLGGKPGPEGMDTRRQDPRPAAVGPGTVGCLSTAGLCFHPSRPPRPPISRSEPLRLGPFDLNAPRAAARWACREVGVCTGTLCLTSGQGDSGLYPLTIGSWCLRFTRSILELYPGFPTPSAAQFGKQGVFTALPTALVLSLGAGEGAPQPLLSPPEDWAWGAQGSGVWGAGNSVLSAREGHAGLGVGHSVCPVP